MKFGRSSSPVPATISRSIVPTAVDVTESMIDRAATALMAEEAQGRLTNCYGEVSRNRARRFAQAALEAALDLRRED